MTPPVALTIAGSDPSAGAGIQADLKAFAAQQVFGTTAITALTAQNTTGVRAVQVVPAEFVIAQVEAVLDDFDVRAVKTGMLAVAEIVSAVADLARAGRLPNLVVDPVMVASSGDRLLHSEAERAYIELLFPHAAVLTPNISEAEALLGGRITTLAEQRDAARALADLGPRTVVVKGGHAVQGSEDEAVDIICTDGSLIELRHARIDTDNTHGTGCTFAAAIAARLARGEHVIEAVATAKAYVSRAVAGSANWKLGLGNGPLDHFLWSEKRSL